MSVCVCLMLNQTKPCSSFENQFYIACSLSLSVSLFTLSVQSEWVGAEWVKSKEFMRESRRERESERAHERAQPLVLTPGSKFKGSQADFLGLDAALMTGLGAWDTGSTGDLQVLVDEPRSDSHPVQVGKKTKTVHQTFLPAYIKNCNCVIVQSIFLGNKI